MNLSLLLNQFSTLFMVGLIWMVQVVHYPLFAKVGGEQYQAYQEGHQTLITLIVGPAMLIELISAIALVKDCPRSVPTWMPIAGLVLLVIIWLSTAVLQVPCHEKLAIGFDANAHQFLVQSNWIRTLAWTIRGVLVSAMLAHCFQSLSKTDQSLKKS
ncbi:MAG: hypothetical protein AAF623_09870 [Planctomycetota bacterium]